MVEEDSELSDIKRFFLQTSFCLLPKRILSMDSEVLHIILTQPRGFCAGVERAIEIVERTIDKYSDRSLYIRHEIVHNQRVVAQLKARQATFVEEVDEIPQNAVTIFSAHGVSKEVERKAKERNLHVIDATCPLVTKVHKEGQRYAAKGYEIILIGHPGHPEVEGTMGQIEGKVYLISSEQEAETLEVSDPERVAYITQTTLSVDDTQHIIAKLQQKFPHIVGPDVRNICYATQNRQTAVRKLVDQVDAILVVGAHNSSNSNRLCEIGRDMGKPSYLIEDATALQKEWIDGVRRLGLTAGASAPEVLVQEVIEHLKRWRPVNVLTLDGIRENVHFKLPNELLVSSESLSKGERER